MVFIEIFSALNLVGSVMIQQLQLIFIDGKQRFGNFFPGKQNNMPVNEEEKEGKSYHDYGQESGQ